MAGALGFLIQRLAVVALCACGLAVYVARLEPSPTVFRLWSEPRYGAFNATLFSPIRDRTQVLDTQTGRCRSLELPRGEALQWVGLSNWIDDRDEVVAAGRWTASSGTGGEITNQALGLGRFSLPSGRPIDRVRTEHVPASAPCWFPGSTSRILYAAADGRLYGYDFPRIPQRDAGVIDGDPQPVSWPNPPAGLSDVWIQEPTWPTDPRLEGRLFAVVHFRRPGAGRREAPLHQIWWLRLDAAGRSVVEAGRLAVDEPNGGTRAEPGFDERLPRLGPAVGGELTLAYCVTRVGAALGELRIARLAFDPQTHAPTIRNAESRTLLNGCVGTPAVFTPSGDALFVLSGRPEGRTALYRIDRSEWFSPERKAAVITRAATYKALSETPALAQKSGAARSASK